MADGPAGFIPILDLAELWGRAGGIPREMALRRICDWAVCDAFPPGALVDRVETPIRPRDLHLDVQAAARADWLALERLSRVLVRVSDLPAFCDRTNTILPQPLLAGRFRRWFAERRGKHLVPPSCPEAAERLEVHLPSVPAPIPPREHLSHSGEGESAWPIARAAPARAGRPKGSGLEAEDQPLIEEMRQAIKADASLSVAGAAQLVVGRAAGGGTDASKAERLAKRYREKFDR